MEDSTQLEDSQLMPTHQNIQLGDDVLLEDSTQLEDGELVPSLQEEDPLIEEEFHSFEGEWMDSWRMERSSATNHSREKKKAKRRRNRNNRRMRGSEMKEVEPETIAVMFVEHTKNGELAKRLQKRDWMRVDETVCVEARIDKYIFCFKYCSGNETTHPCSQYANTVKYQLCATPVCSILGVLY